MKRKKFFILIIFILMICSTHIVQATTISNIIQGADGFITNGSSSDMIAGDKIKNLSDIIYNVLLILGTVIAVIVGSVLGIQFITGSLGEKAEVKKNLIVYLVGCVIIFGAFGIWKLIIEVMKQI